MKTLIKILILPIAVIAGTYGMYHFVGWDLIQAAQLNLAAIGFLALVWIWAAQVLQGAEIGELRQGIHDHELSIAKRLNSISSNMAQATDIKALDQKIEHVRKRAKSFGDAKQIVSSHDTFSTQDTFVGTETNIESQAKVISLESAKKSRRKLKEAEKVYPELSLVEDLIYEGNVSIYLQPKVTILDSAVYGFEVLARLKDDSNHLIPACQFLSEKTKPEVIRQVDAQVLDHTLELLRSLRQQGKEPVLHVNLSIHYFDDEDSFETLKRKLTANKALKKMLVLEVPPSVFDVITSKYGQRLNHIMRLGFRFCIDNCEDATQAVNYMKSGMVSAIKIKANTFLEFDYALSSNAEENLNARAKENGVTLIATHVESKRQVIQLIDNNIEIAQGFLFSEPKPPAGGKAVKQPVENGSKAARV